MGNRLFLKPSVYKAFGGQSRIDNTPKSFYF